MLTGNSFRSRCAADAVDGGVVASTLRGIAFVVQNTEGCVETKDGQANEAFAKLGSVTFGVAGNEVVGRGGQARE